MNCRTCGRWAPGQSNKRPNILFQWSANERRVHVLYRTDNTSIPAPTASMPGSALQLDGLSITQLGRSGSARSGEPLQTLTRLAAANHSCQVLEAISKTALVLRDAALGASHGSSNAQSSDGIGLQALFQNGYDTLVALLQALPQCSSAYSPAAVIPETCVTLFHVHNLLLQAAYASHQEFEVWTELMQAGLELYLRKAPPHIVDFSNPQLETILDAMASQDLWRFQRLLWQRMLPSILTWNSLQDFCSVVQGCELSAQAATTAAAAAAGAAVAVGLPFNDDMGIKAAASPARDWAVHAGAPLAGNPARSESINRSGPGPSSVYAGSSLHGQGPPYEAVEEAASRVDCTFERTAPATAAAASALYDKQAELAEYGSLMSECIRAALDGAAVRGLAAEAQLHLAAQQLLEVATAFDARQRSPSALAALRYSFIPSPEWLSRIAVVGVQAGERLSAAEVVKLLHDLDALAPKPLESSGVPNRWLTTEGQAAVERAVLRHTSSRAWSPQQAVSVIKALAGKSNGPPGDQFCVMVEGLLLACQDARQDVGLLCTILQEAVDLTSPSEGTASEGSMAAPALTAAHLSLIKLALNRAIYLIGSNTTATDSTMSVASTSGRGTAGAIGWRSREFMFERYPRLLHAARRFGYPLQAFRLAEYADELYNHLATSPGHELVAVGPEGLALVLEAVASAPCCKDPQWALAFERACLTLLSVQFSVGYTHPKRWLGLLEATVNALPFPMPELAAGVKALMVRLCDTSRHAKYFWQLLPLVGALERRAASGAPGPRGHLGDLSAGFGRQYRAHRHLQDLHATGPLWTSVSNTQPGASGAPRSGSNSAPCGVRSRAPHGTSGRGVGGKGAGSSNGSAGSPVGITAGSKQGSGLRPVLPPPDISKHYVSDEEWEEWCQDLGQRLALSMAYLSDQDRVAQLSVLGIGADRA